MNIPIMHDDQHGTAIISSAALLNALEIVGKKIEEIILVVMVPVPLPCRAQNFISHWA